MRSLNSQTCPSWFRFWGWPALALAGSLLLVLPPGIHPGMWSAPLESMWAWVWLVAWWAGCLLALQCNAPMRAAWIALLALAVAKVLFVAGAPQQGVWARFRTQGLSSWTGQPLPPTIERAAPPRPVKEGGWQLHRDAFIPPHFINDHRRFNYYADHALRRNALPYQLELHGRLILPPGATALAAPEGGLLQVDGKLAASPPGALARLTIQGPAAATLDYATTATTAETPPQWILLEVNHRLIPPAPWLWQADNRASSPLLARAIFLAGRVWNLALAVLLFAVWRIPWRSFWRDLRPFGAGRWIAPLSVLTALTIPVQRDEALLPRLGLSAAIALACGALLLRELRRGKGRIPQWEEALSPRAAGWGLVALCLIGWAIVGSRFFDSRFPRGFAIFPSGIDSLFHYTFAREILGGDWLHRADAPFTRQPFQRYLLLAPLWAEGEGAAWGFHVHWLVFAATGAALWAAIAPASPWRAWLVFGVWLLALPFNDNKVWVPTLFPETWATFFLTAAFACAVSAERSNERWKSRLAASGALLGLAVWCRNNLLAVFPFWLAALLWPRRRSAPWRRRAAQTLAFACAAAAVVAVIPIRNTLLAPAAPFAFLLASDRAATDLFQGFQLPEVADAEIRADPFLSRLSPAAARFLEGVRRRPGLFLRYQIDRLLILFGLPALREEHLVRDFPRLNLWHLFLWAMILGRVVGLGWRRAFPFPVLLAWGVVLAHVATLVFTGYLPTGYRLLVPAYPFLLFLGLAPGGMAPNDA
ncbi:MAG: hypothetical protein NTW86_22060 [Candidatus Sumerlaeota bacterium]|nr:hypothetical protein [Candidatus Sumerlaeota bacterium]